MLPPLMKKMATMGMNVSGRAVPIAASILPTTSHHTLRELEFATDPLDPVGEEITADEDDENADEEECNIHACPSYDVNPR